jgi:hypothetical protein
VVGVGRREFNDVRGLGLPDRGWGVLDVVGGFWGVGRGLVD